MGFSQNLKQELSYSEITIKELAALSGVNLHALNNYVCKGQIPSVETGAMIARALGMTVESLVFGDAESKDDAELRAINRLSRTLTSPQRRIVLKIIKIYTQEKVAE